MYDLLTRDVSYVGSGEFRLTGSHLLQTDVTLLNYKRFYNIQSYFT